MSHLCSIRVSIQVHSGTLLEVRSWQCRRMIPHELLDRNARIDSNPDTVHARGALPESTRGFPHELHMLHDAVFVFGPQRPNRLQLRHGAFTRDRSQVPYAKVLTKYACTKSDQIRSRGVVRKIREASRFKSTRVENFARGKTKIDLFARYHNLPHELVTGTPESTPSQTGCMHGELLPW